MRTCFVILLFISGILSFLSFTNEDTISNSKLRKLYSQSPNKWPAPTIDPGVQWKELGILPESPIEKYKDSLKDKIELGKILFFDSKLSGSGKISCATCHHPELNWTDGKAVSEGHEGKKGKRNSPSIQNSWFYDRLFWDGRARDLQDQAFAPINSETEMHNEMHMVMININKSKTYHHLFKKAFGDDVISPDRLTEAIATFEKTITSRKSRFDEFVGGDKNALSNSELRGLHIFRTKARCMNCHNGPLFSDNQFHDSGLAIDTDEGYYKVTHKEEDKGKFKTPSLRDVMKTGPWLHNGSLHSMVMIIELYRKGPPSADPLIKPLGLSSRDKEDLLAFLNAISSAPLEFKKPVIPD